ncbi:hypothetical protein ABIE26_000168 [Pedobacter africanus]|uniref:Uncharacterized protein n=1 Tax=Pedobacter africanus TaxID=151894 RepID=A0ACC6KW13_9SPHI|nr:hypothetical protein [Pedobacter africanus]MDR6783344.1 hypothetical protein [Pedobacter africanus]
MKHFWLKELFRNFDGMKARELNKESVPAVRVNKALNKYKDLPIFQSKLDEANETLRTVGLPKLKK